MQGRGRPSSLAAQAERASRHRSTLPRVLYESRLVSLMSMCRHSRYVVKMCGLGRSKGGQTRREQIGQEGYQEMGRKGGLSTTDESGGERAAREGIPINESKFRTGNRD